MMAKRSTVDADTLTAQQQITIMGKLKQQAAAWLLGIGGRSLRDDARLPPKRRWNLRCQQTYGACSHQGPGSYVG